MSPNDGRMWQKLQLNLPIVPIHDLKFKEGDVVLGTHGRSFWVMDNISSLRQLSDAVVSSDAHLFKPRDAYRVAFGGGFFGRRAPQAGEVPVAPVAFNPPSGPQMQYWLKNGQQEVTLSILDSAGNLIRSFSSRQDSMQVADSLAREARRRSREDSLRTAGIAPDSIQKLMRQTTDSPTGGSDAPDFDAGYRPQSPPRAPNQRGVNTFTWDMRHAPPSAFRGMILWAAGVQGPMVPPGTYMARLAVNGRTVGTQRFRLIPDPRAKNVSPADYIAQARFLKRVSDRFSEANDAVKAIRDVRTGVDDRRTKIPADVRATFDQHANALLPAIASVEDSIYQTKSRSGQDPLNYPIRLNNKIGALMGVAASADGRPTKQTYDVFDELSGELDVQLTRLRQALTAHLDPINALLVQAKLPEIPNPYRKPIS